jgi:hypothetical protein
MDLCEVRLKNTLRAYCKPVDRAYMCGVDCHHNGPNHTNSAPEIFTNDLTILAWSRGKDAAHCGAANGLVGGRQ